jgi:hypothetical protein
MVNQKLQKREQVYRMLREGRSDAYIMKHARLTKPIQLSGYKASVTSQVYKHIDQKGTLRITEEQALRLNEQQVSTLASILETLSSKEN